MKKHFILRKSLLVLLLSVYFVSCKGQNPEKKEDIEKEPTAQSKPTTSNPISNPFSLDTNHEMDDTGIPFSYDGQLCHWVRNIFEDTKGNLWFGTNHYGLMRYDGERLEYFTDEDGLGGGRINDIVEDDEGNVWFSTYGGLSKFDGNSFTNYPVKAGPVDNDLWALVIGNDGNFWMGTSEGIARYDGKEFTHFPIPLAEVEDLNPILSPRRISSIMEDDLGNIWFGTDGHGITIYHPNAEEESDAFSHITTKEGLADNNVAQLFKDSEGHVWIGTMFGGIGRYDGKSFTNFTKEGLVNGVEAAGLYEDKQGNIWFTAEHQGVYRYDGTSFKNYYEKEGLISGGILSIYEDSKGRFWMGGWKGLFRYNASVDPKKGTAFTAITKNGPWD
ncbi:MAG: hypothetical protein KTR22_02430 [Flavobacteriaceae bacterium]|nr:hypothetical protein [Flavobacteriaceae bacterium]